MNMADFTKNKSQINAANIADYLTWNIGDGCLTFYWKDPATGSAIRDWDEIPKVTPDEAQLLLSSLADPEVKDWALAVNKAGRTVLIPPVKRLSGNTVAYRGVIFDEHERNKDLFRFTKNPDFKFIDLSNSRKDLPAVQPILEFFADNESLYPSPLQQNDKLLSMITGQEFVVTDVTGTQVSVAGADRTFQQSARLLLRNCTCPRLEDEKEQIAALALKHKAGVAQHAVHLNDWAALVERGGEMQASSASGAAASPNSDPQP